MTVQGSVSKRLPPTSNLVLAALSASLQLLPVVVQLLQTHDAVLQTGSVAQFIKWQLVHLNDTYILPSKHLQVLTNFISQIKIIYSITWTPMDY